jgi:hypothetical protein
LFSGAGILFFESGILIPESGILFLSRKKRAAERFCEIGGGI